MARLENLPIIGQEHLEAMRAVPKPVPDKDWRTQLLTLRDEGTHHRGSYHLRDGIEFGPVHGSLYLFVRVVSAHEQNFSAGLAFIDSDGNGPYRLVRCNGFHPEEHRNVLEDEVIPPETQHIHQATERYLKARQRRHDGFAEQTAAYDNLSEAVEIVAAMTNLVPEGRLLL